jgi:hypothetical protein
MRNIRTWLLVLLTVLLPIRGAVAGAMLCPVAGSGVQSEVILHGEKIGHHAEHESMPHDHGVGHHDHGGSANGSDKCNVCSAFSSVTPLVSNLPTPFLAPDIAGASFPDFSAPATSFLRDGPERPPQRI